MVQKSCGTSFNYENLNLSFLLFEFKIEIAISNSKKVEPSRKQRSMDTERNNPISESRTILERIFNIGYIEVKSKFYFLSTY